VRVELRVFYAAIALVLSIPLIAGLAGAFGGLESLARVLGVGDPLRVPPSLRNSLRAICFMFFALVPLVIWSLGRLPERAGAFRIIVVCGFFAGFARATGWLVDGYPGVLPVLIMIIELGGMPALLLWHARLVRLTVGQGANAGS
jgi:hypothetical protein